MGSPRRRRLSTLALASLVSGACHDSDGNGAGGPSLAVSSIEPAQFVTYRETTFTVRGTGFHRAAGEPAQITNGVAAASAEMLTITFRTDDGTPFGNGTSAEVQVVGTVVSDTEIQGTLPATNSPGIWAGTVTVAGSLGSATSLEPIAAWSGLTVFDIDTESIRGDVATPFKILGLEFAPISGNATVRFTSATPGAFPGGADTLDVAATITDATTVTGTTPVLTIGAPIPVFVSVVLDAETGAPSASSASVLTELVPPPLVPVVVSAVTSPLPLAVATPFTITGSGFLPPGSGPTVEVTFTATSGTPFLGGTASVVVVPGTATSDTSIDAVSPTGGSPTNVDAFVRVTRADDTSGVSPSTIVLTTPAPAALGFAPMAVPMSAPVTFTITGANLPASGTAIVRFHADEEAGTPFNGGTTDSADVVASVTSTQIDGSTPLAAAAASFLAEVTVILPGNLELPMGDVCLFEPVATPVSLSGVTNLNDSGPGSLRHAIATTAPGTPITFDPALAGTIALQSTLLVSGPVEIDGPGVRVVAVSAEGSDFPVFTIAAAASARIEKLTIRGSGSSGAGGGFVVGGSLVLTRCHVADNHAGLQGGGMHVQSGGSVALHECELTGNVAGDRGGAVFVAGGGSVTATACTLSENKAGSGGGAIATAADGTVTATNCTITSNGSTGGPDGGGAIYVSASSTVSLTHCTTAKNIAYHRGGGVYVKGTLIARNCIFARDEDGRRDTEIKNANGTLDVQFSLVRVGGGSGLSNGVNGNLIGTSGNPVEAHLGPLEADGGPTRTMSLHPTSPAIDSASATTGTTKDQRGINRPKGPAPDMGAYELTVQL